MDNVRFALICALGVVVFFLWQAWQQDYGTEAPKATAQQEQSVSDQARDDVPGIGDAPRPASDDDAMKQSGGKVEPAQPSQQANLASGDTIRVITDKLDATIDLRGGDLRQVSLLDVPRSSDQPESDLRLLNDSLPNFFITQSGLVGKDRTAPDHRDAFTSKQDQYRLPEGADTLEVPLTWQAGDGRTVTKTYTFHRNSYKVGLRYAVSNASGSPWVVSPYLRFWRTPYEHGEQAPFAYSFSGVGLYQAEDESKEYFYRTADTAAIAETPLKQQQSGGWIAMVQHYFLGAIIPGSDQNVSYFAEPKAVPGSGGAGYATGYIGEPTTVQPGESGVIDSTVFLGPKLQDQLDGIAPGLGLSVDYGIFTVLAGPIFWVLEKLHSVVGNWGVAIILLTVIIKLAFYKLSETQYRAMARMRKFAPRMQQLKEQYGDDKQKLQEKMMELYKKEGFNPLGGCWPLLVQMPVFIALYWVLRESVELRHADFMLWITDLSAPDPYYILPVLFGITMFAQQRLSSSSMSMDPMQQRMMQIMPVGLSVFFAFFPAGLVLYWLTNNLLSIAQQWYIYRKIDHEAGGHKAVAK